ncbi:DUF2628 domain-containing protein [Gibbsiella quercinecans]|uniref:DUF2628 domain-containing protein n=1 Tax=Gibbsiella quercinecans TaxID=929813 RepID=UPI003F67F1B3
MAVVKHNDNGNEGFMSKELSPKWQARFALYDSVGGNVTSPEYQRKLKEMKFFARIKYVMNFYAFFFGIIYFCILGLWKKGLVLFVVICAINLILGMIEYSNGVNLDAWARGVNLAYAAACGSLANYSYYLKEVKGIQGWNPWEGLTKASAARIAQR